MKQRTNKTKLLSRLKSIDVKKENITVLMMIDNEVEGGDDLGCI